MNRLEKHQVVNNVLICFFSLFTVLYTLFIRPAHTMEGTTLLLRDLFVGVVIPYPICHSINNYLYDKGYYNSPRKAI